MKVEALGARPGRSCTPEVSLAEAALLLRHEPGGLLAVTDDLGSLLGLMTDQDFVEALAQAGPSAGGMPVRIFLKPSAPACRQSDELRDALRIMRTRRVLSLPIVDGGDRFQGVLTFEDLALEARPDRLAGPSDLSHEDLVLALKSIAAGRRVEGDRLPTPPLIAHL